VLLAGVLAAGLAAGKAAVKNVKPQTCDEARIFTLTDKRRIPARFSPIPLLIPS
jgi:hypothetical protein